MSTQKIKILHLEDQRTDAEQISWMLKKANLEFETMVVDKRADYKQALKEFNPQIILSDHSLPAFNSLEALEILRQSGLRVPFILVTGAVSEEFAVEAMREGADDYILKDRLQRLPIAVRGALKKYQLEREQKKTEAQLRNIDTNSLDVICSIDAEGRFIHVSAASAVIWGYEPSELKGRKYMELVYEEDADLTIRSAASVMAGVPVTMFENRYIRKDGTIVPMLWSARWEDTEKTMYCIAKDATEKKRMEQAFRSEQQRFIDLFLDAPASMCILKGPDHVYEIVNPLFQEFSGKRNIIGKKVEEVSPELKQQGLIDLLDTVYRTGESFSGKEMVIRVDREGNGTLSEIYFNFICQPYRNTGGNVEGIFFFAVDVTDQVQARQKIEESKNQYVHLVQNLPAAVYTCDAEGKIVLYNKAAVELWGREPKLGKELWCGSWRTYNSENKPVPLEASPMARAIKEGRSIYGEELVIERPDGSRRHVIPHPSPILNKAGELTGAINVLIDITDRKKTELETLTLVDRLQNRNQELRQFAYMVSHNLRSPIAKILGLASIFEADAPDRQLIVDKIAEATTHLDDVVTDINTILSARNSDKEKKEYVEFSRKLTRITQALDNEIKESQALITGNFACAPGVTTIKSYLYSIMYNLVSNAIKYRMPERAPEIHLRTTQDERFICLCVKDNGRGIDMNKNGAKIFGLYKRFHDDTIPGKGVGLHLVKTHIESLGGKIEIVSEVNTGTEFKVYFPKNYEQTTE